MFNIMKKNFNEIHFSKIKFNNNKNKDNEVLK